MEKTPEFQKKSTDKTDGKPNADQDINIIELANIINLDEIQSLMDDFYQLTNIGVGIIDLNGKILATTGWQDICTKFHRAHPETLNYCIENATNFTLYEQDTENLKFYHCKNNMWNIATPIIVDEKHVANLFLGQFFFDDEEIPYETFRLQAKKYGFNEKEYIEALDSVPRWNKNTVYTVFEFYSKLTLLISLLGYSNMEISRVLTEKDELIDSLHKSEKQFRSYIEHAPAAIFVTDEKGNFVDVNNEAARITGYSKKELLRMNWENLRSSLKYARHSQTIKIKGNMDMPSMKHTS